MAWIKFDKDLVDDPRILRAAEELSNRYVVSVEHLRGPDFAAGSDVDGKVQLALMRNAVTGALLTLWVYADTHIRGGDVLPISITAIDRLVGIDGFYELIGEDWICPSEDGQTVTLPGYCEKNGLISKENRRSSNAERQRRFREKNNTTSNAVSNADVTRLDLDLDLDKTKTTKEKSKSLAPDAARPAPKPNGKIEFDPLKGTFTGISEADELRWQDAYPAVPIPPEIAKAAAWLKANPANKKKNCERFLVNWFSRSQERAGRVRR